MTADRPDTRTNRIAALVVGGAIVWLLVLTVAWAAQPLSDSVVIGVDEDGRRIAADVECNTLFESEPVDRFFAFSDPEVVAQEPCQSVHSQARVLAVINVVLVVLVIIGALVFAARSRRSGDVPSGPAPAERSVAS